MTKKPKKSYKGYVHHSPKPSCHTFKKPKNYIILWPKDDGHCKRKQSFGARRGKVNFSVPVIKTNDKWDRERQLDYSVWTFPSKSTDVLVTCNSPPMHATELDCYRNLDSQPGDSLPNLFPQHFRLLCYSIIQCLCKSLVSFFFFFLKTIST